MILLSLDMCIVYDHFVLLSQEDHSSTLLYIKSRLVVGVELSVIFSSE